MAARVFSALAAFAGVAAAASATCPAGGPLSCHNTTAVDTCCFNYPGGHLLQTQFWDTNPATGPSDSWTIHGLWPDHCTIDLLRTLTYRANKLGDGTYDSTCDSKRQYTNITQILQGFGDTSTLSYMQTYWKDYTGDDESFWEHEWGYVSSFFQKSRSKDTHHTNFCSFDLLFTMQLTTRIASTELVSAPSPHHATRTIKLHKK